VYRWPAEPLNTRQEAGQLIFGDSAFPMGGDDPAGFAGVPAHPAEVPRRPTPSPPVGVEGIAASIVMVAGCIPHAGNRAILTRWMPRSLSDFG
jgi:hypothetical protein